MKKQTVRLTSEPFRIKNAMQYLKEHQPKQKADLTEMTHQDLEFEKYKYFYIYQWKKQHIATQKKIKELEEEARVLQLLKEKEVYEAKVKEHDEIQTKVVMDEINEFPKLFMSKGS